MLPPRHRNQGFELGFAPCPLTNDGAPHALNVLRAVLEGLRALKHEHRMLVRRVLLPLHAPAWATAGCGHTASCADGGGGGGAALTNGGMGGFVGNGNGGPPERLGYSGAANGNLRLYHGALRDATAAAVRKEPALAVEVVRGLARRWPRAGAAEKTLALLEELRLVLSLARGPQLALLRAPLLRCLLLATGGSGAASATAVASASALAYHTVRFAETQPARGAPHAASNGRASATAAAAEEEEAEASFSVGGGAWMTARQVRCRASKQCVTLCGDRLSHLHHLIILPVLIVLLCCADNTSLLLPRALAHVSTRTHSQLGAAAEVCGLLMPSLRRAPATLIRHGDSSAGALTFLSCLVFSCC